MPRPTRRRPASPRPSPGAPGYLYLIRFDNGVLKAGCTSSLETRIDQHDKDAGRYDLKVTDRWTSALVGDVLTWEHRLLAVLARIGTRTANGREYFSRVPFSIARYQAKRLPDVVRKACCCGECVDPVAVVAKIEVVGTPMDHEVGVQADLKLECGTVIRCVLPDDDLRRGGEYPLESRDTLTVELDPEQYGGLWTAHVHLDQRAPTS
jgi:hypothetical protein